MFLSGGKVGVYSEHDCVCQEEVLDLNRRLMTIDCQLKKSELSRKHLELSNKKLLGFAQVQLVLDTNTRIKCLFTFFT